ncbi:MAG: hypothetical protein Q9190_005767 [Brigantiaea leucoxantha]
MSKDHDKDNDIESSLLTRLNALKSTNISLSKTAFLPNSPSPRSPPSPSPSLPDLLSPSSSNVTEHENEKERLEARFARLRKNPVSKRDEDALGIEELAGGEKVDVSEEEVRKVLREAGTALSLRSGKNEDEEEEAEEVRRVMDELALDKDIDSLDYGNEDQKEEDDAFPALPSAPTSDPVVATKTKMEGGSRRSEYTDAEIDSWCIICCDDALVRCTGCAEDLYCWSCWCEGHTGPDAGFEYRHGWIGVGRWKGRRGKVDAR